MPPIAMRQNHAAHPVEQLAASTDPGALGAFVRRAGELLSGNDGIAYEPARDGLLILAQAEDELDDPRRVLRDAFGSGVRFGAPSVRLRYADGWQQPIMGFRVAATAADLPRIESGLAQRGAKIADIERRNDDAVVRGQAPLARLLGYPRALRRLSAGRAHATFWLSHYEPLWSYSSETMACYPG